MPACYELTVTYTCDEMAATTRLCDELVANVAADNCYRPTYSHSMKIRVKNDKAAKNEPRIKVINDKYSMQSTSIYTFQL